MPRSSGKSKKKKMRSPLGGTWARGKTAKQIFAEFTKREQELGSWNLKARAKLIEKTLNDVFRFNEAQYADVSMMIMNGNAKKLVDSCKTGMKAKTLSFNITSDCKNIEDMMKEKANIEKKIKNWKILENQKIMKCPGLIPHASSKLAGEMRERDKQILWTMNDIINKFAITKEMRKKQLQRWEDDKHYV